MSARCAAPRRSTRSSLSRSSIPEIGIDSWAVDYGLIQGGRLTAEPFHYRDERTLRGAAAVHEIIPFEELYPRDRNRLLGCRLRPDPGWAAHGRALPLPR